MAKMNKFPKELCVVTEEDGGGDVYFLANDRLDNFIAVGETRKVAFYTLSRVMTVKGKAEVS